MRLSADETAAIVAAAHQTFGPDVVVRLFGSRLDDSARGGDIDLLIETRPDRIGIAAESAFLTRLFDQVDERKVDLVLVAKDAPLPAFAALARERSVALT